MGNVINIGHNSRFLTPKGLVKIAAKETGKAVVEDARISLQRPSQSEENFLYPNLKSLQSSTSSSVEATNNLNLKNNDSEKSQTTKKEK